VSSLATVVSARLEVDVTVWDEDPEGRRIAADINRHLPEHVRVFGAYSTPKSFQARRACVKRTYDYLLPRNASG
jgi:tRNA pseudouridine38-40 synthase